jgi:hypothetical protein
MRIRQLGNYTNVSVVLGKVRVWIAWWSGWEAFLQRVLLTSPGGVGVKRSSLPENNVPRRYGGDEFYYYCYRNLHVLHSRAVTHGATWMEVRKKWKTSGASTLNGGRVVIQDIAISSKNFAPK